ARGHPLRGPLRSAGSFAPLVRAVPLKVTSLLSTERLSPLGLPYSVARGHPLRGPLRSAGSFAPLVRAVPLKVTSLLSTERLSPLGLPCTLTHSLAASPARAVRVARSLLLARSVLPSVLHLLDVFDLCGKNIEHRLDTGVG